jgi:hypothetical protein
MECYSKPKRWLNDLFLEVQDYIIVIPMSLLRKFELLTRPTLNRVPFNHFLQSTSSIFFLMEAKRTFFINFSKVHHKLESSRGKV